MTVFYLPVFTATFLWYYIINIYGIVNWENPQYQTNQYYNYGFYQFSIPPLEIFFLLCSLYSQIYFWKLMRREKVGELNNDQYLMKM